MSLGPWIRVNADLLDDAEVRAFGAALYPRLPAWQARACAAAQLVALWGKMAKHQPDGQIDRRDDEQIEEWAQWKGKQGEFAASFRARFQDPGGVIVLWQEYQGAALARREADRVRKSGGRQVGKTMDMALDILRDRLEAPQPVTRKLRTPSGRNGTETSTVPTTGTAGSTKDLGKGEARPQSRVEKPEPSGGNPPSTATASSVVNRFTARFYRSATPARRTDIAGQMAAAMLSTGVTFQGSLVRAVDADHLDDCCLEVMEDPPRDANAAFVFVLRRLRDTYLEVLSRRAKDLAPPKPSPLPAGMAGDAPAGATPIRAALAGVLDGLEHSPEDSE